MSAEIREYLKKIRELQGTGRQHYKQTAKKYDLFGQAFFLFYGAALAFFVGFWGNMWATVCFEYLIKKDVSLLLHFWISTVISIGIVLILIVAAIHFYNNIKRMSSE